MRRKATSRVPVYAYIFDKDQGGKVSKPILHNIPGGKMRSFTAIMIIVGIIMFLALSVWPVLNAFAASVFDKRDFDIQRGQAIIEGTANNTLPTLEMIYYRMAAKLLNDQNQLLGGQIKSKEDISALVELNDQLKGYEKSLAYLRSQLDFLAPRPLNAKTFEERVTQAKPEDYTRPASHAEIKKLTQLASLAGASMSCLIRTIEDHSYSCKEKL